MLKVLYICTHNRCRSILAEAITRHHYPQLLVARSGGSQPAGEIHPLALQHLQQAGIDTAELRSQSWDDCEDFAPDIVFTLCDSAAGESCPVWFGDSIKLHWGLADPSALRANDAVIAAMFVQTINTLTGRADALADIAQQGLQGDALRQALVDMLAHSA